jgi:hypothetical protein
VPRQGIFVHGHLSYFHNPLSYYFDGPQQQPNNYNYYPHRDQTDGVYIPFSGGSHPMNGTPVGMGYTGQPSWGQLPQPYGFGFQPYMTHGHGNMYPSPFTGSHIPYDFYGIEMGPDGNPRVYGAFITEIHK